MDTNVRSGTEPRRVLLVDDNDDAVEVLAELLSRDRDLQVTTACCGEEALQRARVNAPHVVVLDLGLPDMDGCDVLRELKASARHDTIYIALTGRSSGGESERSQAAGFDHHFVKPPDLQALRSAIRG